MVKPFDQLGAMIDWEHGALSDEGIIELFQNLLDTGLVWQLQGCYGRQARALLEAGLISPKVTA
jgi:hypothetical protein